MMGERPPDPLRLGAPMQKHKREKPFGTECSKFRRTAKAISISRTLDSSGLALNLTKPLLHFIRHDFNVEHDVEVCKLQDTLNAGSSTGWTDEKHMLYISSLEESFVTQLYDGQVNSTGVFCRSPSLWSHKTSYKGNRRNIKVDQHQGYWGMVEADGAESRVSQAEHIGSPSCYGDQEDRKAYYMDDDAATTEPSQERISYHARLKNSGGSSASHFQWHGHSLSRTELSDQNFVDEETEVSGEQSRGCSKKQLKHAADTTSGLAAPSGNANLQLEVFHLAEGDYSDSSSDFDIGLLNANPASHKVQGPRRWSV